MKEFGVKGLLEEGTSEVVQNVPLYFSDMNLFMKSSICMNSCLSLGAPGETIQHWFEGRSVFQPHL